MEITFAFVREGTADDGLVPHIRTLLIRSGATSAVGAIRNYKGSTLERLAEVISETTPVDLIFVHRDSDKRDSEDRHREVNDAASSFPGYENRIIPVVPVQEMEAWLLCNGSEIREVVGRKKGKAELGLPPLRLIEGKSSPKEILELACLAASETSGARHKRERKRFPQRRANLLERLDIDGDVRHLPSFSMFCENVEQATKSLLAVKVESREDI